MGEVRPKIGKCMLKNKEMKEIIVRAAILGYLERRKRANFALKNTAMMGKMATAKKIHIELISMSVPHINKGLPDMP